MATKPTPPADATLELEVREFKDGYGVFRLVRDARGREADAELLTRTIEQADADDYRERILKKGQPAA